MSSSDNRTDTDSQVDITGFLAQGIHDVPEKVQFRVLGTNLSKEPAILHKQRCIALGVGPSKCTVDPEENDILRPTVEARSVQYKEVEYQQRQMKSHMHVERKDAEQKAHDWNEEVKMDSSSMHFVTNS